jgi:hypothetical protein
VKGTFTLPFTFKGWSSSMSSISSHESPTKAQSKKVAGEKHPTNSENM